MSEKGLWEKMIEEYPECEEDIKGSYGYQIEMLRKQLDKLIESIALELKQPLNKFYKALEENFGLSFRQRFKRFFKYIYWSLHWWIIIKWDNLTKKD
jgi:hypothetical protein